MSEFEGYHCDHCGAEDRPTWCGTPTAPRGWFAVEQLQPTRDVGSRVHHACSTECAHVLVAALGAWAESTRQHDLALSAGVDPNDADAMAAWRKANNLPPPAASAATRL